MKLSDKALEKIHADVLSHSTPAKRWRTVPVYRTSEPKSEGVEFVVGRMDPPVTVSEIVLAALDPVFFSVPADKIQLTGSLTEDGYTVISLSRVPQGR